MPKNQKKSSYIDLFEKVIIILSLLVYLIAFPPFFKNQILAGHDAGAHITYLRIFSDALSQGQFPVNWIEWVHPGQNQPLFVFYQPLLYYLAEIPHVLGMNILNSLYQTVLFLWLFSGFMIFLFVRNLTKNTLGALISSLLYFFAPYHILDVFVRSAYPEVAALAFAPGLFWALERFYSTKKIYYLGFLSLFFAAVFISHPPTLIMFSLPFSLYFLYLIWKNYQQLIKPLEIFKNIFSVILGLVLGFGLAAFFAIPAFVQQNLINSSSLQNGYLDFHNHFVCIAQLFSPSWGYGVSQAGCNDNMSFQVGILNWIVILVSISLLAFIWKKKIKHENNLLTALFIFIAIFGIYMTTSLSQPFWEGVPYLSFVQFTWRFLSITVFSIAVLAGILFTYLNKSLYKIVLFLFVIIITPLLVYSYISPSVYLPKDYFAQDSSNFYKGLVQGQQGTAEPGYMPISAKVLLLDQPIPESEIDFSEKNTKVDVIKNNFSYKEYSLIAPSNERAQLFIHYFPGWKFYVDRKIVKPDYSNIYGFVVINVPAGKHAIIARFENTTIVKISNLVSLISFIILIVLFFWGLFMTALKKIKIVN